MLAMPLGLSASDLKPRNQNYTHVCQPGTNAPAPLAQLLLLNSAEPAKGDIPSVEAKMATPLQIYATLFTFLQPSVITLSHKRTGWTSGVMNGK